MEHRYSPGIKGVLSVGNSLRKRCLNCVIPRDLKLRGLSPETGANRPRQGNGAMPTARRLHYARVGAGTA